jgi:hypothetical protein
MQVEPGNRSLVTGQASRKSLISISSLGLWLPFSLRTTIMPTGTPAAARRPSQRMPEGGDCQGGLLPMIADGRALVAVLPRLHQRWGT